MSKVSVSVKKDGYLKKSLIKEVAFSSLLALCLCSIFDLVYFINIEKNSSQVIGTVVALKKMGEINPLKQFFLREKILYYPQVAFFPREDDKLRNLVSFIASDGEKNPTFFVGEKVMVSYHQERLEDARIIYGNYQDYLIKIIPFCIFLMALISLVKRRKKRKK